VLDRLQEKIKDVFRNLSGSGKISEKNIEDGIREIKLALLEADVNYKVVKEFVDEIKRESIGQKVISNVNPVDLFYKIVYEKIKEYLGPENKGFDIKPGKTNIVMLVGLQGSGKTTTAAKLAYFFKDKASPLIVGADIYRPAAKEQLRNLAVSNNFAFYTEDKDPVTICKNAINYAKKNLHNLVILDTAGRLHIDNELMKELVDIKKAVLPDYIFFVADAMVGQSIVDVAKSFDEHLDINGVILTKFDSDAKGGATLSIKKVTGKSISFIGVGEKIQDFEVFYPERIASRLIGRGDILTLVEKTTKAIEEYEIKEMTEKMMSGKMDLEDLLKQLKVLKKLGGVSAVMEMLPLPSGVKNADPSEEIKKMEAIILSMTPLERKNYRILNISRKKRIVGGSGTTMRDITKFLDNFQKMSKMVKKFSKNAKILEKFMTSNKNVLDLNDKIKDIDLKNFKL